MTEAWMTDLVSTVTKVAPLLGSVLGGPWGGIAGSLISEAFGGGSLPEMLAKISSDPEAEEKLKDIEAKHEEALKKLSVDDTISARGMTNVEKMRNFLVAGLLVLTALNIVALIFVKDSNLNHFLLVSIGVLLSELKTVFKLYFGS